MADGRHVGKYSKFYNSHTKTRDRLGRNLGGHILSCARHVRNDAVAMATDGRCLAKAHALNILQLWASGGRTREPISMKFGMQQQVRTAKPVMTEIKY